MTAQSAAPLSLVPSVPDVVGRIGATGRPGERLTVQLIAKSPDTKVARELLARPEFEAQGVGFEAIFTRLAGTDVLSAVADVYGAEKARRCVRVVNVPEQGEIVEQVNFGAVAVWTGKPLKAWVSASFADGQLSEAGLGSDLAKMSAAAFRALWNVSEAAANDAEPSERLRLTRG